MRSGLLLTFSLLTHTVTQTSSELSPPPDVSQSPPRIWPSLAQTVYLVVGDSLDVTCTATGSPPPSYTWRRGDQVLHTGPHGHLLISDVTHNLTGEISCTSSNSQGEDQQSSQVFVVNSTRLEGDRLNNITRSAGESLQLTCDVEVDPQIAQSVQRRWSKDGAEVGQEDMVELTYLVADNAGLWQCAVSTAVDSLTIQYSLTVVTVSPQVTHLPPRLAGMEGETVRVECAAEGVPAPEVSLKLADTELSGESEVTGNTTTTSVSVTSPGTVTCLTVNMYGSHKAELNVELFKRTIVTEGVGSTIANSGETVSLNCEVRLSYLSPQT